MINYILPFSFAFFSVIILIPFIRKLAFKYHFVDIPNKRKIHAKPVPLLGGLAIYLVYVLNVLIFIPSIRLKIVILLAGSLIVGIGFIDDYYKTRNRDFSALPKFIVQLIVGLILFIFDIKIEGITSIFGEGMIRFTPSISLLVTLLWVVGLMNMINFLDGLDGLASGIAIISSTTLFLIAFVKGQEVTSILSIILMGVSLGFLKFNFYPAKIFMGDAGSAFLGLILAIISIEGAIKSATILSITMVVLALGVPIFDTALVVFNRYRNHRPIYKADQTHAHHRLLKRGYTQKQAVALIYIVSILFSIASIAVLFWLVG